MARLFYWFPVWSGNRLPPEESAVEGAILTAREASEPESVRVLAAKEAYRQVSGQASAGAAAYRQA